LIKGLRDKSIHGVINALRRRMATLRVSSFTKVAGQNVPVSKAKITRQEQI